MATSSILLGRKKIIIISLLAVSIVTIILGLGLGLGLQLEDCRKKDAHISCRNRCYEPFDTETPGCRCDAQCGTSGGCCHDYIDLCVTPSQQWECTNLRCSEKRLSESKCHCSVDCMEHGDCCTNYESVCKGGTEWKEDVCEDIVDPQCPASFSRQPLLLISLDGFRAEYLKTWSTILPVIDKLRTCGTHSPYIQAVFPSTTYPNHYTIVTGLYPESHGLVENSMYDPVFDASFDLSGTEKENPRWYLGQPIWHTVMNQGLKAGTFFWPGSDVQINGSFPNIYEVYDGNVPSEERVFKVLQWLRLPDNTRPDFYTLYLGEPDKSGHKFGPVSGGVIEAIQNLDRIIGQLMNGLKQMNLHRCVNIIIVADHGMEDTSCTRMEFLENMLGNVNDLYVYQGAFGRIRSNIKGQSLDSAQLVANLTDFQCRKPSPKLRPFQKTHLPKRFHYASSRRIDDTVILVEPKWLFARNKNTYTFCDGGAHGYDNDAYSMQAMFLSYGPKFQYKTQVEPFSNIELYNLMCDVLEISPAQNNGTHGSLNHLLRNPRHVPQVPAEQTPPGTCPLFSLTPTDDLGCTCTGQNSTLLNRRLNLTSTEVSDSEKRHMVFGRPRLLRPVFQYCLLHQLDFVSAYSQALFMPLWTSFTLSKPADLEPLPEVVQNCLRADVRIAADSSPSCDQYTAARNITLAFLYPPNLNSTAEGQYDGLLMSNVVPMYQGFKKIWVYLQDVLLKKYAQQYNGINVQLGPAFDYNYDGLYDTQHQIKEFVPTSSIPVPTHYFVILTSCENASQPVEGCHEEMQAVAFLIPHRAEHTENCMGGQPEAQWVEDLLWFHKSRVRDVELITGLDLYQGSGRPVAELLRLKTRPTAAISKITSA
ncbi:venom phosphodiesterase [Brienomyrus brachyistius]|uniref:venom phosphodiesterase n=1 Tax=Brienomyrus brachyistius TaxID=42636 RepID=UPI0020B4093F|nr:venom phosphodiesterase [Brienomyrus brachyistius]